jgi:hypothetical protein
MVRVARLRLLMKRGVAASARDAFVGKNLPPSLSPGQAFDTSGGSVRPDLGTWLVGRNYNETASFPSINNYIELLKVILSAAQLGY